jgi:hypothetical protein
MRAHPTDPSRPPARRGAAQLVLVVAVALSLAAFPAAGVDAAQAPIDLRTASAFAVLAGSAITNTGASAITGDVGSSPTPAITGFGTVALTGTNHGGDAVTQLAKTHLASAYTDAAAANPATAVATELGGRTLQPGVYGAATLGITGVLTLDPLGDPNAVFIFQASTTLITAAASSVLVVGGASLCNVFWQVGSSATLAATSLLIGSVLADTSISTGAGAQIQGRLLAQSGAVTMDSTTVTPVACAVPPTTTTTAAPTTTAAVATTTTAAPTTTTTAAAAATTTTTTVTPDADQTEPPARAPLPTVAPLPAGPLAPTVVPPAQVVDPPSDGSSDTSPPELETAPGPPAVDVPVPGPDRPPLAHTGVSTDLVPFGVALIMTGGALCAYVARSRRPT